MVQTTQAPHVSAVDVGSGDYASLKKRVKDAGLLEKQPAYLVRRLIVVLLLVSINIVFLFVTDNVWLQLLNAITMGFTFGQFGFILHDTGHRQAFRTTRANNLVGRFCGGVFLGMSFDWWCGKHNEHHAHPNQHDLDPDIEIPFLAFTEEEALEKRGFLRFMVKHQSRFFLLLLCLYIVRARTSTIEYFRSDTKRPNQAIELFFIACHFVWLPAVLLLALPWPTALMVYVIEQILVGAYMAMVFAPNHKGMPVFAADAEIDFLRLQVLTARNIYPHPVVDFLYGGLNYQVEHHLFPTVAQNNLFETQKIVKGYCEEHDIPYYETTFLGSYFEILAYLKEVSNVLRPSMASSAS